MDEQKEVREAEIINEDAQKGLLSQLEALLDEYMVKKAPFQIPMGGKEFIANVSPYLVILAALVLVPVLLAFLGLGAIMMPFAMMGGYGGWGLLSGLTFLFSLGAFALEVMAISGLFKRTKAAWRLVFYATVIMCVGNAVTFQWVSGLINAVISWYVLFQVKELYKN